MVGGTVKYLKFEITVPERNLKVLKKHLIEDIHLPMKGGYPEVIWTFLHLDSGYWQGGEMTKLDWNKLTFGKYSMGEILVAVKNKEWQALRVSLKGKPLQERYDMLVAYLEKENYSLLAKIRVTNYVNALRRGGMIEPKGE
jgi:hypothetical protein